MNCYSLIDTAWGVVAAGWSERGLYALSFPRADAQQALADIAAKDLPLGEHPAAAVLAADLKLYFQGYGVTFSVPLDWTDYTPFQQAVLRFTATIPYGQTLTYGQVAAAIGRPRAARAVGGALHNNRTPLVIPCHRVIGANGNLTGFGGGIALKHALLLLEKFTE